MRVRARLKRTPRGVGWFSGSRGADFAAFLGPE
jgi:hypothetical protein